MFLAVLFDESSKSFAFENFNFIYLDSMYSLDSIKNKSPMKLDRTKKFLGFGDPKLGEKIMILILRTFLVIKEG